MKLSINRAAHSFIIKMVRGQVTQGLGFSLATKASAEAASMVSSHSPLTLLSVAFLAPRLSNRKDACGEPVSLDATHAS